MRESIGQPVFTEPRLVAVVRPFRAEQPATVDATGWFIRQPGRLNSWATYMRKDEAWYLWSNGALLLLTETEPGEDYTGGDYYVKTIEDDTVCFQGSYGYKDPDDEKQLEVYVWSPFDIVLSRLAEILRRHPDLTNLIPERNLMDLSGGGILKVTKDRKSTSDYPEIIIEPRSGAYAVKDSTDFMIRQDYRIIVLAEEQVVSRYFFPVKWACLQALSAFLENPNGGRLLDLFFVGNTVIVDISDAMSEFAKPRWRSELTVRAEIFVPRTVLRSA